MKKLTFEGEKFPKHVANFLIGKAVNIEELNIILDGLNQGQFQGNFKSPLLLLINIILAIIVEFISVLDTIQQIFKAH